MRPLAGREAGYVVYESAGDLFIARDDGSSERQLTFDPAWDTSPAISPDSKGIAFSSNRNGFANLWVMGIDGSDLRVLTRQRGSRCRLDGVDYSPDGERIAFSNRDGDFYGVFELATAGGEPVRISAFGRDAKQPRYDADGIGLFATVSWPYDGRSSRVEMLRSRSGRPHPVAGLDTFHATQVFTNGRPKTAYSLRLARGNWRLLVQSPDGTARPLDGFGDITHAALAGPKGPGSSSLDGQFVLAGASGVYRAFVDGSAVQIAGRPATEPYWWVPRRPIRSLVPAGHPVPERPSMSGVTCYDPPAGRTVLIEGPYRFFLFAEQSAGVPHIHAALASTDTTLEVGIAQLSLDGTAILKDGGYSAEQLDEMRAIVARSAAAVAAAWASYPKRRVLSATTAGTAAGSGDGSR